MPVQDASFVQPLLESFSVWKGLDGSPHDPRVPRCCLIHSEHNVPYHKVALDSGTLLRLLQLWKIFFGSSLPKLVGHVLALFPSPMSVDVIPLKFSWWQGRGSLQKQ